MFRKEWRNRLLWGSAAVLASVWLLTRLGPGRGEKGKETPMSEVNQRHTHTRSPLPSPEEIAALSPTQRVPGGPEFNRLIHEESPYLLQHARNPVDWYPWGEEAFARARKEDKPIFLSVGYSTCHWCHVMERESFEKEDVARLLNEHFIAIKVDREERPDVDDLYMNATQLLTGRGGWPNSVWLTPEGRPWYAGTYFPPEDYYGRPGFKTILLRLAEVWRTRRPEVESQAAQVWQALQRMSSGGEADGMGELTRQLVGPAMGELRRSFDPQRGGFGGAPKFPPHGSLSLLLYEYRRTKEDSLLAMATRTLDAMAQGGIYDHVGGGFHRYSTDERWFLPHFEKMLYDNAQLSRTYVDAYLLTGREDYRRVAAETYEWVLREMIGPEGGFYSALDADSEGEEGKFYLWRREEILALLGEKEGQFFCQVYQVEPDGNFREEASGHRPGTNILHLAQPLAETAQAQGLAPADLRRRLERARQKLLEVRNQRVWPHLDDKVLTAWNGLMIGSFAFGGRHLKEPRYTQAAEQAAHFVLTTLRRNGRLLRTYRDGVAKLNAYLEDYAFLAEGLLELYEATGNRRWLEEAEQLADVLLQQFRDEKEGGFFFTSADHEEWLVRSKQPYDQALPSGNGMAAQVLVRLGQLTGKPQYRAAARTTLDAFVGLMERAPRATESLILATALYFDAGGSAEPEAQPGTRPEAEVRRKPVTAAAFASRRTAAPGETVEVKVRLTIDEGWHVHSHQPKQENLIPTSLRLEDNPVAALDQVRYPDGQEMTFAFSPEPLSVYAGEVWIKASVTVSPKAETGAATLKFKLRVQACDDQTCLAPETLVLPVPLGIGKSRGTMRN